jgi:hypothetical protein
MDAQAEERERTAAQRLPSLEKDVAQLRADLCYANARAERFAARALDAEDRLAGFPKSLRIGNQIVSARGANREFPWCVYDSEADGADAGFYAEGSLQDCIEAATKAEQGRDITLEKACNLVQNRLDADAIVKMEMPSDSVWVLISDRGTTYEGESLHEAILELNGELDEDAPPDADGEDNNVPA